MTTPNGAEQSANTTGAQHWNSPARLFHWLIAALIIAAIVLAYWADAWHDLGGSRATQYQLYMLHKSLGLTVLLLALPRLLWRLIARRPGALDSHSPIEHKAASAVHLLLYGLLFALPISGWLLNSAADIPLRYFSILPVPSLVNASPAAEQQFELLHLWLGWLLLVLLPLHMAGALKHHWIDADSTLLRILPGGLSARAWLCMILPLIAAIPISMAVLEWRTAAKPPALQQPMASATPEPSPDNGAAQQWQLVSNDQQGLRFQVEVMGETVNGHFSRFRPIINFDANQPQNGSLNVTIDTASASTGNSTRDELLPETDWFAVASFPAARFKALSIQADTATTAPANASAFLAEAELTIRDQTQRLQFPFIWQQQGDSARLTATVILDRTEYSVGLGEWLAADSVAHQVKVLVDIELNAGR